MKDTNAQRQMFFHQFNLSGKKLHYLEKTWAGEFYNRVMPVLVRIQNSATGSDLNRSRITVCEIAETLGVLLLKHQFDLSDIEAADHYTFDLRWQKALGLNSYDCMISPSIVSEGLRTFFYSEYLQTQLKEGLKHISKSNKIIVGYEHFDLVILENRIFNLGWSRLVHRTVSLFISQYEKRLHDSDASMIPQTMERTYLGDAREIEDARPSIAFTHLKRFIKDMTFLVALFRRDSTVSCMKSYSLLKQLHDELTEIFVNVEEM